jgi:hypothetical protein
MHVTLAAAEAAEGFNGDYYLAIVTILPILMITTGLLANFAQSIPRETQVRWRPSFYALVSFLYLYSPVIAAIGVVAGVLALMYRDGNAVFQWITFVCFMVVLIFLAVASVVYLAASDPAKDVPLPKVFNVFTRRKAGQEGVTSEPAETSADTGEGEGSTTQV